MFPLFILRLHFPLNALNLKPQNCPLRCFQPRPIIFFVLKMDSFSCVRDRIAAKRGKQGTPSLLAVGSVGSPGGMATMPPYSSEDVRNKKNWRRHLECYI